MNGQLGMYKGIGGYTRMGVSESGVMDYVIGSPELFDMISLFKIGQKVPESDHLPLIFSVMCSIKGTYQSGSYVSWQSQWKYQWTTSELPNIKLALCDDISTNHQLKIKEALADRKCTDIVAAAVNSFLEQACRRTFPLHISQRLRNNRKPCWYDKECRNKRSQAIKAGERVVTVEQKKYFKEKCNEYRSCKQRKKRAFKNSCIDRIEKAFMNNTCDMWNTLSRLSHSQMPTNQPEADEFFYHF